MEKILDSEVSKKSDVIGLLAWERESFTKNIGRLARPLMQTDTKTQSWSPIKWKNAIAALSIHINDGEAIAKIHLCQP